MKESQIQKKILDYLQKEGYSAFKVVASNRNGVSDIIACSKDGEFIAIEVKSKGKLKNVTKLQQLYIDEVNERGGHAFVADSVEMVKEKLNDN